jgi:dihydroxyacetone kinase-like protein
MLQSAAAQVTAQVDLLCRLDANAGDGDHGTTMKRAMGAVTKAIEANTTHDVKGLLNDVAMALLNLDSGATGPLLGSLFLGASEAVAGDSLDAAALATAFEGGLANVQQQTKAQIGDKTMIDALVPAVRALRTAADGGMPPIAAVALAAAAAEAGAASTTNLQARFGRARNLGERSKGFPDAGATSMGLIWRGFAEAAR